MFCSQSKDGFMKWYLSLEESVVMLDKQKEGLDTKRKTLFNLKLLVRSYKDGLIENQHLEDISRV